MSEILTNEAIVRSPPDASPAPAALPPTLPELPRTRNAPARVLDYAIVRGNEQLQRIGRLGMIGAALLVFAGVFVQTVIVPLRETVAGLRTELASAERAQADVHDGGGTPAARAEDFVAKLPTRADLPVVLAAIVRQAAATGLELERGTYELSSGKGDAIARYRMSFPVNGSYPQVRRFVDATLAEVPAAALESLTLERGSIADAQVLANLKFVVFVRDEP